MFFLIVVQLKHLKMNKNGHGHCAVWYNAVNLTEHGHKTLRRLEVK